MPESPLAVLLHFDASRDQTQFRVKYPCPFIVLLGLEQGFAVYISHTYSQAGSSDDDSDDNDIRDEDHSAAYDSHENILYTKDQLESGHFPSTKSPGQTFETTSSRSKLVAFLYILLLDYHSLYTFHIHACHYASTL